MLLKNGAVLPEYGDDVLQLYIMTNKSGYRGAATILNTNAIIKHAQSIGADRIAVLPSSIHEVILAPLGAVTEDDLTQMVKHVNYTSLEDNEILSDRAYIFNIP